MVMVFKILKSELESNTLLKRYNLKSLGTENDHELVLVQDNDYYQIIVNMGGDSLDNPRFEVLDYGNGGPESIIFKLGVGEVYKPYIGKRSDNYKTKALDSLRGILTNGQFGYMDYNKGCVSFEYTTVEKVLDYLKQANITDFTVKKYRDSVVVKL